MQYPTTPRSSTPASAPRRSQAATPPNAPFMSPRTLPPSPITPSSTRFPEMGMGTPMGAPGAPYMHAVGLPPNPAPGAAYGLMTPPTTPQYSRSQFRSSSPTPSSSSQAMHPLLAAPSPALDLDFSHVSSTRPATTCMHLRAPHTASELSSPATHPPTAQLTVTLLGGALVIPICSPSPIAPLTVEDVLNGLAEFLQHRLRTAELSRFPSTLQRAVIAMSGTMGRSLTRVEALSGRTTFGGLERRVGGWELVLLGSA